MSGGSVTFSLRRSSVDVYQTSCLTNVLLGNITTLWKKRRDFKQGVSSSSGAVFGGDFVTLQALYMHKTTVYIPH